MTDKDRITCVFTSLHFTCQSVLIHWTYKGWTWTFITTTLVSFLFQVQIFGFWPELYFLCLSFPKSLIDFPSKGFSFSCTNNWSLSILLFPVCFLSLVFASSHQPRRKKIEKKITFDASFVFVFSRMQRSNSLVYV